MIRCYNIVTITNENAYPRLDRCNDMYNINIMIYYASWQHKLNNIHAQNHSRKQGNGYKNVNTYTRTHAQKNYKHSAELLHTADLIMSFIHVVYNVGVTNMTTVYIIDSCHCSKVT